MNVQDRRRILGPAGAKPLVFANAEAKEDKTVKEETQLNKNLSISLQRGIISNANGSSIVETSGISLLTSVYGPRSTRSMSFEPRATLNIILQSNKFDTSNLKEISNFLISVLQCCVCLEKYPKSGIDLFINFNIEDEDELVQYIPIMIMSCMIALMDADIEVSDIIGGLTIDHTAVCLGQNGDQLLGLWKDPSSDEQDALVLNETIAKCQEQYSSSRQQLIEFISNC
ncbi:exosome complex component Mtr3p [Monosporozyma unispora]|nr:3'-5'-exoribonuclease [Kazachstania unispora]